MEFIFLLMSYLPSTILFVFIERKFKIRDRIQKKYPFVKRNSFVISSLIITIFVVCIIDMSLKNTFKTQAYIEELVKGFLLAIIVVYLILFSRYDNPIGKLIVGSNKSEQERIEKIDFCYYCGAELGESNVCPTCKKEVY